MILIRKNRQYAEHSHQVAVIDWCNIKGNQYPELNLIFAIPNAGTFGTQKMGNLHKREGLKSGVPDLFLPIARRGFHGLFIEMKSESGKPTEHQKRWEELLKSQGYYHDFCYGSAQAIELLSWYLEIK